MKIFEGAGTIPAANNIQMDVVGYGNNPNGYDSFFAEHGSQLFMTGTEKATPNFPVHVLERIIDENGPYDILHCNRAAGRIQWLAIGKKKGIPVRIYHLHNPYYPQRNWLAIGIAHLKKFWIKRYLTHAFFASEDAKKSFLGKGTFVPDWAYTVNNPTDFEQFRSTKKREEIRKELGISEKMFVFGNVARLTKEKNHSFLLNVFSVVHSRQKNSCLLLIGDGKLRSSLEQQAKRLGISEKVRFLGFRKDTPDLLATMDVFVFPSLFEGLGISLLEAQAAGLPSVISENVPKEATIIEPLVTRLPLSASVERWADAVLAAGAAGTSPAANGMPTRQEAYEQMLACRYSLPVASKAITELYLALYDKSSM